MGRKALVVANTKLNELDLTDSKNQELHAEIRFLREELQMVTEELAVEKARRRKRRRSPDDITVNNQSNVYVFDDKDETRAAFDEFFSTPDPHLDKVRGFLLD